MATVVKDKAGRNRYIAFRIQGGEDLEMVDVIPALREAFATFPHERRPWLVLFSQGEGVVRCSHLDKEEVIQVLHSIDRVADRKVRVTTLGTSGTVRKAVRKYLGRAGSDRQHP